jgi:hypothetical protein
LRHLLSHTKDCKTLLARTLFEGNNDYFDRVVRDSNHSETLVSNICSQREELFDRVGDALKCGKYLVSGIHNQIHKGPTNNTISNNTNKLVVINDLWKKMNSLSDAINMNKEKHEILLVFFIECRLQELQKVSTGIILLKMLENCKQWNFLC